MGALSHLEAEALSQPASRFVPPQLKANDGADQVHQHGDEEEDDGSGLSGLRAAKGPVDAIVEDGIVTKAATDGVPHIHDPARHVQDGQHQIDDEFRKWPPVGVEQDRAVIHAHAEHQQNHRDDPGQTGHHQDEGRLRPVVVGSAAAAVHVERLWLRVAEHVEPLVVLVDVCADAGEDRRPQQQLHAAQDAQETRPGLHVGVAHVVLLHPLAVGQRSLLRPAVPRLRRAIVQERQPLLLSVVAAPRSSVRVQEGVGGRGGVWGGAADTLAAAATVGLAVGSGLRLAAATAPPTPPEEVLPGIGDEAMNGLDVNGIQLRLTVTGVEVGPHRGVLRERRGRQGLRAHGQAGSKLMVEGGSAISPQGAYGNLVIVGSGPSPAKVTRQPFFGRHGACQALGVHEERKL